MTALASDTASSSVSNDVTRTTGPKFPSDSPRGRRPPAATAPEAVGRVTLTVRLLTSRPARWERDNQAGDVVAPLASFALILTDFAVAMLDAASSVPPQVGGDPRGPHLASRQA